MAKRRVLLSFGLLLGAGLLGLGLEQVVLEEKGETIRKGVASWQVLNERQLNLNYLLSFA